MLKLPTRICLFHLALAAVCLPVAPLNAADCYAGKTIELVVGGAARRRLRHLRPRGGAPSRPPHSRQADRSWSKNMPGAGARQGRAYISQHRAQGRHLDRRHHAGRDHGPAARRPAPSRCSIRPRSRYVGTANSGTRVCVTLKSGKIQKFEDAQKVKAKFGGSAPNDSTCEYGYLHKHTSGALWDIVPGYRGTPEIALAMERGEIDGICGWDWSSFKSQKPDWLRDNKANMLMQVSLEPHPRN